MTKRRKYIVEGAELECTLGAQTGKIIVTSQQKVKIQGKLKATNKDKELEPPFFKKCKCYWPNPTCKPNLLEWQLTSKKAVMGSKTFVMEDSKIQCVKGGIITIKNSGQ